MIDSFEKQLEVKKFEVAKDRVKFCQQYLEERGMVVMKQQEKSVSNKIPSDYRIIQSSYIVPKYLIDDAKNVSYIKSDVIKKLSLSVADEITHHFDNEIKREIDIAANECKYTLRFGVFRS